MAHKHLKNSGMAAIVLGCSLGVAQAAGPSAPPIDPSQLRTLHNLLKPKPGVPLPQTGGGRLAPGRSVVSGWNLETCVQLIFFTDGSNYYYIIVNQDGSFFSDNNFGPELAATQGQLSSACAHGDYYVHVTNAQTNAFDAISFNEP